MDKKHLFLFLIPICFTQAKDEQKQPSYDQEAFNWSRTMAEVAQMVGEKHFKLPENAGECWAEAINGFVSCLDPHSGFLAPKAYKQIIQSTSGSFGGIGIVIDNTRQPKDKFLTIIDTIPDGPSDNAGIKPLDKIVEIEGELLEGMTTEEATAKLKGKPESTVEIKVLREGHPDLIVVSITRDVIKEQNSLSFYLPDQQIYYVSLSQFSQNATKQIEDLLKKSNDHSYKGLIVDMRNNSGGLLNVAIDIVGLFLPNNSLVVETKGRNNQETQQYHTKREPIVKSTLPIFILINNYTASAGEILAGCLQLHSKQLSAQNDKNQLMVFLLGSRTFGKGSVQTIVPVSNNSALKLTTALYYLPGDISIQGMGIEPDFVVERMLPQTEQMKWFTKSHGRECAMTNHITTEKSKELAEKEKEEEKKSKNNTKQKKWSDRMKDALQKDNQLKSAITLINIFDMAHTCFPGKVANRQQALSFLQQTFASDNNITLEEVKPDK
jgi:carboxyl-terminal processing protease